MAKNKRRRGESPSGSKHIPNYTGSLDAKVPGENIVYVDRITETKRWYAVSEGHDGGLFAAHGNTEPGTRRAAGLRALAHLTELANGKIAHATAIEVAEARVELSRVLVEAVDAVTGYNGEFPENRTRELIIFQLSVARGAVESKAESGTLVRYVGPIACFLAGGFANGLLGKLGERALDLLDKIIAK